MMEGEEVREVKGIEEFGEVEIRLGEAILLE